VLTLPEGDRNPRLGDRYRVIEEPNLRLGEFTVVLRQERSLRELLTLRLATPAYSSSNGQLAPAKASSLNLAKKLEPLRRALRPKTIHKQRRVDIKMLSW
jgi:hypothetical protein